MMVKSRDEDLRPRYNHGFGAGQLLSFDEGVTQHSRALSIPRAVCWLCSAAGVLAALDPVRAPRHSQEAP